MAAPLRRVVLDKNINLLLNRYQKCTSKQQVVLNTQVVPLIQISGASSLIKSHEYKLPKAPKAKTDFTRGPTKKLSWREVKISQAMKMYMESRSKHDAFMKEEKRQFEVGKRHLANIMGEDPEHYTQKQIDGAIAYLMPSGLFDDRARPQMKPPDVVLPKAKIADFGADGRPFSHLFYTGRPRFYGILFEAAMELDKIRQIEANRLAEGKPATPSDKMPTKGRWMRMAEVKPERVPVKEYNKLMRLMIKILHHDFSAHAREFIAKYRTIREDPMIDRNVIPPLIDKKGRKFQVGQGRRKTATAEVIVYGDGKGNIKINGEEFLKFFPVIFDREMIAFPLIFTKQVGKVDIEAMVSGGGKTGQAGAVRVALSRALMSFAEPEEVAKMRFAGLLNADPRRQERKKPGRHKARKSFTWKAR